MTSIPQITPERSLLGFQFTKPVLLADATYPQEFTPAMKVFAHKDQEGGLGRGNGLTLMKKSSSIDSAQMFESLAARQSSRMNKESSRYKLEQPA